MELKYNTCPTLKEFGNKEKAPVIDATLISDNVSSIWYLELQLFSRTFFHILFWYLIVCKCA